MVFLFSSDNRRRIAVVVSVSFVFLIGSTVVSYQPNQDSNTPTNEFQKVSDGGGLNYSGLKEQPGIRGDTSNAGVYVADYNNDGYQDVLAIGGRRPILFKNSGNEFQRSNELPNFNHYIRAALFLDHNKDGWTDLLLLRHNTTPIFLQNFRGTYRKRDAGLNVSFEIPIGASTADYNNDGCLDLVIIQNGDWIKNKPARMTGLSNEINNDTGNPNVLFKGNCETFTTVENAGIRGSHWSLAVSFVDLTHDGLSDIHVANDFYYDVLYVNQGNDSFRRIEINKTNRNGMSSEISDVNGDGRVDIFVTNIFWSGNAKEVLQDLGMSFGRSRGNNMLINRGQGIFMDQAPKYHVVNGRWGWAAVIADLDNDGDQDIFHTTKGRFPILNKGHSSNLTVFKRPRYFEGTRGEKFLPKDTTRLGFESMNGRGAAQLDYNDDGDLDLIVADATGDFRLYENYLANGTALQVKVIGEKGSPKYGTRVYVHVGNDTKYKVVNSRTDFLSQESKILHFGIGDHKRIERLRVVWPDGSKHVFTNISTNSRLVIASNGTKRQTKFSSS